MAGLKWPDLAQSSDDQVMQAVTPPRESPDHQNQAPEPDYPDIRHELQTNKHVPLQLLRRSPGGTPEGYRYSRFCDLYRKWLGRQDRFAAGGSCGREAVCRLRRRHIPIHSATGGDARRRDLRGRDWGQQLHLLRGDRDQGLADSISGPCAPLSFWAACPKSSYADNLKSGVTKACRYEPSVN